MYTRISPWNWIPPPHQSFPNFSATCNQATALVTSMTHIVISIARSWSASWIKLLNGDFLVFKKRGICRSHRVEIDFMASHERSRLWMGTNNFYPVWFLYIIDPQSGITTDIQETHISIVIILLLEWVLLFRIILLLRIMLIITIIMIIEYNIIIIIMQQPKNVASFTSDFFMTATISSKKALDLISFICSAKEHVPSWWSPKSSWLDPVLLQPNVRSKALADDGSSAGRWAGPRSHSSCRVDCAWNLPHPTLPQRPLNILPTKTETSS